MPLSFPQRRGRSIRPCLVVLPAVSVSYDVVRLGVLVEPAWTVPTSGLAGRGTRYRLRIARQQRHVHLLWQIMCPHLRIVKACPCNHLRQRTRCLRTQPHSECQRTSKHGTANSHRMENASRCHLSKFRILSGASQSPIPTNPARLITLQLTKATLYLRVRPPRYRRLCLLMLWTNHCLLRCHLHLHLQFSWRSRSLSRCRFRCLLPMGLRRRQAHHLL